MNGIMNVKNKSVTFFWEKWSMCENKSVTFFALVAGFILFFQPVDASESVEDEVTIDSPAEVIAEDFVRVAVVPKPWVYRLWSWLGTDQIDVRKLTDTDLEKYIQDDEKRSQIKEILNKFKTLDTFKRGDRLEKWTTPIYLSPVDHPVIHDQLLKLVEQLKNIKNIEIYYPTQENEVPEGISSKNWFNKARGDGYVGTVDIKTFGKTDFDISTRRYTTKLFKTSSQDHLLSNIKSQPINIYNNYIVNKMNILFWDNINGFTDVSTNSKRHGSISEYRKEDAIGTMYYVEGSLNRYDKRISDPSNNDDIPIDGKMNAECHIYYFHPDEILRALTTECVFRSLGLLDVSVNSHAVLGIRDEQYKSINWIPDPTEYDLLLLNVLYDEKIKPGMTREEVMPIAKKIIEASKSDKAKEKSND
jgi:hypothetical protein